MQNALSPSSGSSVLVPYTMPKAEMHVHIALALSVEIFLRRVKETRTSLTPDFLLERERRYYPTLQEFHATYEAMRHITSNPYELAEVTQSYLERIAREGCIYAEISSSYRPSLDFAGQIDALTAAIEAARRNMGIETRIVVTSLRDAGHEVAEQAVTAVRQLDNPFITAFGLVGNEAIKPLTEFHNALNSAWHEAGLGLVPHVGEQRIENALDFFAAMPEDALKNPRSGARKLRIGHGVLTHRSSELMKRFADHGICFEICLSANKRIGYPEDLATEHQDGRAHATDDSMSVSLDRPLLHYFQHLDCHPLRMLMEAGVPICLGSDNPLLMNTNIGKEYALARKYLACSVEDCLGFTRNALTFANLDKATAQRLMQHIDVYAARLARGETPDATALGYSEGKATFPSK